MFRSARRQLVAWNVLVFAVVLGLLGVGSYEIFNAEIYKAVDDQLTLHEDQALQSLPSTRGNALMLYDISTVLSAAPYRTVVTDPQGRGILSPTDCPPEQILQSTCPRDALALASPEGVQAALVRGRDIRTAVFRDEPQRVLTFRILNPDGTVQVLVQISRTATGEENALHELRLLLVFGGLLGLVLAGVGSLFLAGRALVPIRKAFARQRQFTADASHELRTPLALIRANAEMLARHSESMASGDGELIGEIISETDHLNRLVSDLLTLARADSDTAKIVSQPVDFRSLVADVHEDLHAIAESTGVETSLSLDGPVTVRGDEVRLRQLLLILLDNALKYTEPGGRVDVSVQRSENRARLIVADTGIGIASRDLPHIFDRFYRADRAREHASGGTGLGLSIARWIVQAHHGTIRVDSETGKGTRFQVDLPVA